ncbi:MAG: DUF2961 domain-containing protein [Bacteroidota bacterium]|nr:DUF2961 domain-containing protein [Bacteroidota bacterium]
MKKILYPIVFLGICCLFLMTGCESGGSADLEKILNPGYLPYLKPSKLILLSSYDTTGGNNDFISIPTGKTQTLFKVVGPGIITRVWFRLKSEDPYYLRRILIKIYWDNETDPSVEVPFGDFFGNGFEYKQYTTPYLSMSSGGYTCFFPMPFEKSARFDIVNETGQPIPEFFYQVDYHKMEGYLSRDIGYFHAFWKRDIRTDYDSNYVLLNVKGKGHIVGVNMNIQSYDKSFSFLEGDEKVYVDGEKKPSLYGTGTEDYFSSGWYFNKGEYAGPYNGLILSDDSLGRIAAYRFHIYDPISFKRSIKFTFEHGTGNKDIADYSSTIYWYQSEPHQKFPPILKAGLRIPLRTANSGTIIEAEKLSYIPATLKKKEMEMSAYGAEWTGNKQLLIETRLNENFSIYLDKLIESRYNINIYYSKGPDYGNVGIYFNSTKIGEIHGFSPEIIPAGYITLPGLNNSGTAMALKFVVEGKDPGSTGYNIGLEGISLTPDRHYIPDWYIVGPFPNPIKKQNIRYGLDSIFPPETASLDLQGGFTGAKGKLITWKYVQTPENGYVDLTKLFTPNKNVVCYAVTYIYSDKEMLTPLYVGSDDGIKVFFNNKEIIRYLGIRIAEPDQEMRIVKVKRGWNKLMLKIENNCGGYAFYARILDRFKDFQCSAKQNRDSSVKK